MDPPERSADRRPRFLALWAGSTLVLLFLTLLWSLATPMPSGPDESSQVVKAAAVVHGTLIGTHEPGYGPADVSVRVPLTDAEAGLAATGHYRHPRQAALRGPRIHASSRTVNAVTYFGHYPPLYYAVVGLPSWLSSHVWSLRAMRVVSCLLNSLLLGLAVAAAVAWSRSRWMLCGVALAVTPMATYLSSVVNPSGLEITAAVAAWTTGAILILEPPDPPRRGLVAAFAGALLTEMFVRALSPLWVVVILGALVVVAGRSAWPLARLRSVRRAGVVVVVGLIASTAYVLVAHSTLVERFRLRHGTTSAEAARRIAHDVPIWIGQLVGAYGSPNVRSPDAAWVIWGVGVAALVVTSLIVDRGRRALLLVAFGLGALAILPFGAQLIEVHRDGIIWQGRYEYPVAAGIPILAAAILARRRRCPAGALVAATVVVVAGQGVSYYWVLRRYVVGLAHTDLFRHAPGAWVPPLGTVATVILASVAIVGYGLWIGLHLIRRPDPPPETESVTRQTV